ncbi:aldehyde dehydrogenase (NAD+) [Tamaricihabitans halophyticus]|uniref:Aldehyde dehydrogenase (NAD+) n=1 Tax=Tamaricihabitans halophyticus TaxID=1262583 RepID=A0A4R2QA31_9PSEU|nr:aldehyde dehydrogenase [Tamaricihabitans halophyticus]TCP45793.1 aldehyde dehydrogenase (NAD+) [Tamaricihabitans halophyticus]
MLRSTVAAPEVAISDEILVGGRWRRGTGELLEPIDPATGDRIAAVHAASPEDVHIAVRHGQDAVDDPTWRGLAPHQRASYLYRIAALIERDTEQLALLQTRNTGKTLAETRALVASAAGTFRFFAAAAETREARVTPARGDYLSMSTHEPIGVVGAITPWNSPIASDAQKVAPALAAGNAVLLKPAEWTPLVALALGRIVMEAGIPPGLFSVLPGPGATVGDALVRHPGIGKVSFTGGTATGRTIGRNAAEKIMPVSLELGGKSPNVVFADASLEHAIAGLLFGIFSSSGQSCVAGSRIFVAEVIYDQLLRRLVAATRALRVGPGTDPRTQVGPLVHPDHRDRVAAMVDGARLEGARVHCGGAAPTDPELGTGAYYLPTVLDGLDNSAATCQEEIFGPVAVVLPFHDETDLIQQANDTSYGLACGIWTSDYRKAWRIGKAIQAGTVWVNTYKQFSISTPFSGVKESGLGTEKGRDGILAYTHQKSIYIGLNDQPLPWAEASSPDER